MGAEGGEERVNEIRKGHIVVDLDPSGEFICLPCELFFQEY